MVRREFHKWLLGSLTVSGLVAGCRNAQEGEDLRITGHDHGYQLSVVIDMSGSYSQFMQTNGRAYKFLMAAINQFFQNRVGENDRILLSQISANGNAILWHGSPAALRRDFPSAGKFNQFLADNSNPNGSLVYRGLAASLEYLNGDPGVRSGRTKTAVLVLSDMEDNEKDSDPSLHRVLQALAEYGKNNGICGMYWVALHERDKWMEHLREAKLRSWVVESKIVSDPALPKFD